MWKQGGEIVFTFASPTRIGKVGLMDVRSYVNKGRKGLIRYKNIFGTEKQISFLGLGANSVQNVVVDKVVKELRVVLKEGGAVRNIEISRPENAVDSLAADSLKFLANSVFTEYIPRLEFDLSYGLTSQINKIFGQQDTSCLFNKWVNITVNLSAVTSEPKLEC